MSLRRIIDKDVALTDESYELFLQSKRVQPILSGLESIPQLHSAMFPYQRDVTSWALRLGRSAAFLGTGMGKTLIELEWSKHISAHTSAPVLLLAPLAVAQQTANKESLKFGFDARLVRHQDEVGDGINVTNYDRIEDFDPSKFSAVVCDESSIFKSMDGKTRSTLIEMFASTPYKLCATATPAPNDYMELGNHSEFLGVMTATEMLSMFFVHDGGETQKWRLKGHARKEFWKWVCSWAVSMRKPSDIGYSDEGFVLPPKYEHFHMVQVDEPTEGFLFALPAETLQERIGARRASIDERVELCVKLIYDQIKEDRIQQAVLPQERRSDASTGEGLVREKQRQHRQGGEEYLSSRILQGPSREIQIDSRNESEAQCCAQIEVCDGCGVQGKREAESARIPAEQPGAKETSTTQDLLNQIGGISGHIRGTTREMPDLRIFRHEPAEDVPDSRSLSSFEESKGDSLLQLQYSNRENEGQPKASPQSSGIFRSKWLVWANLNDEQDALARAFGSDCVSIDGRTDNDEKLHLLNRWFNEDIPILISKARVFGFGMNFQHCHNQCFVGVNDSWEQFYQAVRRSWRFGQTRDVHIHIIAASTEGNVVDNLKRKDMEAEKMAEEMAENTQDLTRMNLVGTSRTSSAYEPKHEIIWPKWMKGGVECRSENIQHQMPLLQCTVDSEDSEVDALL